jgi:hypothetical protein
VTAAAAFSGSGASSFETPRRRLAGEDGLFGDQISTLMVRSALFVRVSNHEATGSVMVS